MTRLDRTIESIKKHPAINGITLVLAVIVGITVGAIIENFLLAISLGLLIGIFAAEISEYAIRNFGREYDSD